jgi:hypothetical protein
VTPILAFVLQSPDVTEDWVSDVAAAIAVQLARDVAPAWGLVAPRVQVAVYRDLDDLPANVLPIVILPSTDVAGDYGYHGEMPDGRFYARVFTRGLTRDEISRTISHEAIEAFIDPTCNRWVDAPDGRLYALEVVDPVAADGYVIELAGASIVVSDFVLPAWFDTATPATFSTDYLGRLKGAWRTRPSGYAQVIDPLSPPTAFPSHVAQMAAARAHLAGRAMRRFRRIA